MIDGIIVVISPNETINNYIRGLLPDCGSGIKTLLVTDKIIDELKNCRPGAVLLYNRIKTKTNEELHPLIKSLEGYSWVPLLQYSFNDISGGSEGIIKLPYEGERLCSLIEKFMNRKSKVLIVDDSPVIHKQIVTVLNNDRFSIIEAYNGREALELTRCDKPDIVISDIEMPVMDGFEFCRQFKSIEENRNIPVILYSTLSGDEHREMGFKAGADEYVVKTSIDEEILFVVYKHLNK